MEIFSFFGSILGYVLYGIYFVVQNYGVAIILFTLLVRAAMFPLNMRQAKSSAAMARISAKQKELQERYGKDRQKYQEEVQKLYDKEGTRPGSGCLMSLIPFPIMLGLYYTVMRPLTNALHLNSVSIANATSKLAQIPGMGSSINGRFIEMEFVKNFDLLKPYVGDIFGNDMARIEKFSHSFNFLGLDLLQTPWGGAWYMWIIPVLCVLIGIGTQVYSMFTNDAMKQQQGCMKFTMLALPLITGYFALTMPGAIGFYWVVSNAATFIQMYLINKFYSKNHITANSEARRIARRVQEESRVKEIPIAERRWIPAAENVKKAPAAAAVQNVVQEQPAVQEQPVQSPTPQEGKPAGGDQNQQKQVQQKTNPQNSSQNRGKGRGSKQYQNKNRKKKK